MDFERIQHPFSRHDDLFRLFLDGEGADEGGNLLGRLPLGQLPETLLPRPHTRVDDLEEELSGARVEDEDGAVDWLGRQVAFKRLKLFIYMRYHKEPKKSVM